jgi:hypothetical protein
MGRVKIKGVLQLGGENGWRRGMLLRRGLARTSKSSGRLGLRGRMDRRVALLGDAESDPWTDLILSKMAEIISLLGYINHLPSAI